MYCNWFHKKRDFFFKKLKSNEFKEKFPQIDATLGCILEFDYIKSFIYNRSLIVYNNK